MHDTLTVDLDGRPLTIETGKIAKQSDGAAVVKCGDTVVLVTACYAKEAEGHRLPSAHRRVQGIPVRGGPDPRRLLQARGAPHREGDPHLPDDRPAVPAALPRGLQPRDADRRPRPLGRRRERPRRPRDQRRRRGARDQHDPLPARPRRRPRRQDRRPLRLQPDREGAQGVRRSTSSSSARTTPSRWSRRARRRSPRR